MIEDMGPFLVVPDHLKRDYVVLNAERRHLFSCHDCDVTWKDTTFVSKCWSCDNEIREWKVL